MRIAFDAKRAFRNSSGLGNYSRMIIQQLCKYHPENEYILYSPRNGSIEPGFPPDNSKLVLPANKIHKVLRVYWRTYSLKNIIEKARPDIYHGLSNELPLNIHKSKIKRVVTIHDLIFLRFPALYNPIDRKIYERKFRYAALNADIVIAVSEQTKKDLVDFFGISPDRISVVYQSGNPIFLEKKDKNNIDSIRQKYRIPSEYILNVGTIEERKNLLKLIQALNISGSKTPLVVIGNPRKKYFRMVREFIRKNRMENIHFLQNVPTEDLPCLYQGARLFVYPSSFEGFGIPVLEAIQSEVPVIAGKGHCLEETGGPESLYIDPFNKEEFAQAIDNVLGNSELRKKMIEAGKKHGQQFLPEKTINNLYRIYESVQ